MYALILHNYTYYIHTVSIKSLSQSVSRVSSDTVTLFSPHLQWSQQEFHLLLMFTHHHLCVDLVCVLQVLEVRLYRESVGVEPLQ